jgi:signal transduction histidine kinase
LNAETQMLFVYVALSGGVSIAAVYLLARTGIVQRFTSLRWTLLTTIILLVVLVLVNVFFSARLMLINDDGFLVITLLLIFSGIIATIAALFISRALIERIHALSDATARVARGELGARLEVRGNDELARLGAMFNQMNAELELVDQKRRELEQMRRDLVAWASHDLRSPLAAVRAMNEALIDGVVSDEATTARYRLQMQREIEHLGHLIDDLLELAQMDAGQPRMAIRPTNIGMLVDDALMGIAARVGESGITLEQEIAPDLPTLHVAPDKIARILYNLLDNAIQHTPSGGGIRASAAREAGGVTISVHNTGSVIAPDDLPHVFDRFYRGENARTPRGDGQRGTGLGLAIARGFAESHGGRISVQSSEQDGTTFRLWLPQ